MNRYRNAPLKTSEIHAISIAAISSLIVLSPTLSHAHSSTPHPFKEASIAFDSAGPGRTNASGHRNGEFVTLLVGHDGSRYTRLEGDIEAGFRLRAKVKTGHRIFGFVVTTGDPANENMLPDNVKGTEAEVETRKLDTIVTFNLNAATAISTGVWGSTPTTPQDIIDRCNASFPELPAMDQENGEIELTIHAGFAANRRRGLQQAGDDGWYDNGTSRPAIAHTTLPVHIICLGNPFRQAENPPPPRAGNTLHSIDLKVDQHGERCPKEVTVTAYADYRWQAKSRMRVTVAGGRPKFKAVQTRKVTFAGKTFHRAEAQFKYTLDPGQKTFKLTVDRGDKSQTETVEIICPPFKVTSAWLKYEVENSPVCPKKVREIATFHTTRPGWVEHEIEMEGGLVVSSGKLTSKRHGNKYVATAVRNLTMNAIDKQFMADAVDYPANSGWVPLKVDCLEMTGDFSFVDKGSPACPRTGRAFISFKSNLPDDVHYSLDCTNGKHFSGVLKPAKTASGNYVAAVTEEFPISETSVYSCALQSVMPGPVKLHKWKGHTFKCVHRSLETGAIDLRSPPKPGSDASAGRVSGKSADKEFKSKRRRAKLERDRAKREQEARQERQREALRARDKKVRESSRKRKAALDARRAKLERIRKSKREKSELRRKSKKRIKKAPLARIKKTSKRRPLKKKPLDGTRKLLGSKSLPGLNVR